MRSGCSSASPAVWTPRWPCFLGARLPDDETTGLGHSGHHDARLRHDGRTHNNALTSAAFSAPNCGKSPSPNDACMEHLRSIGHDPEDHSVVYENAQARERTQILMDVANQAGGFVVGTGDLSEIVMGWCTYNADHMSMYAVNCSVPKTLFPAIDCVRRRPFRNKRWDNSGTSSTRPSARGSCPPRTTALFARKRKTSSGLMRFMISSCITS